MRTLWRHTSTVYTFQRHRAINAHYTTPRHATSRANPCQHRWRWDTYCCTPDNHTGIRCTPVFHGQYVTLATVPCSETSLWRTHTRTHTAHPEPHARQRTIPLTCAVYIHAHRMLPRTVHCDHCRWPAVNAASPRRVPCPVPHQLPSRFQPHCGWVRLTGNGQPSETVSGQ